MWNLLAVINRIIRFVGLGLGLGLKVWRHSSSYLASCGSQPGKMLVNSATTDWDRSVPIQLSLQRPRMLDRRILHLDDIGARYVLSISEKTSFQNSTIDIDLDHWSRRSIFGDPSMLGHWLQDLDDILHQFQRKLDFCGEQWGVAEPCQQPEYLFPKLPSIW